jgi:glycosidase
VSDEARVGPDTPLDPALGLRRARAATLLMLALPGSAYIYQGEELGLPEVVDLPEEVLADPIWERSGHTVRGRDGARVPIPWTRQGPSSGSVPARPGCRSRRRGRTCRSRRRTVSTGRRWSSTAPHSSCGAASRRSATGAAMGRRPARRLFFEREDAGSRLVCAVNLGADAVPLPRTHEVLLSERTAGRRRPAPVGHRRLAARG